MAKNQFAERPQTQAEQERSLSRRDYYSFPSLGGELFNLSPFAFLREVTDWMDRSIAGDRSAALGMVAHMTALYGQIARRASRTASAPERGSHVRTRLLAGGRWIRTIGLP